MAKARTTSSNAALRAIDDSTSQRLLGGGEASIGARATKTCRPACTLSAPYEGGAPRRLRLRLCHGYLSSVAATTLTKNRLDIRHPKLLRQRATGIALSQLQATISIPLPPWD